MKQITALRKADFLYLSMAENLKFSANFSESLSYQIWTRNVKRFMEYTEKSIYDII